MSLSTKVFASSLVFVTALVSALGANASPAAAFETSTTVNGVVYTLDGGGTAYVSGRTSDVPANLSIASSVTIGGASREVVRVGQYAFGVKLTYKWYRSGVAIKGATKASYKLTKTDLGKKITLSLTATKVGFTTVTKTSMATAKVSR